MPIGSASRATLSHSAVDDKSSPAPFYRRTGDQVTDQRGPQRAATIHDEHLTGRLGWVRQGGLD